MTHAEEISQALLKLADERIKEPSKAPLCFIGFDGFTDEIISVVSTRQDASHFETFKHIAQLGNRILEASGKSGNIELVVQKTKLGGNAPILTNALLEGGYRIIFCGNIGEMNNIEPLFEPMASRCLRVIPLGPSAHSDALEFNDGKIILGKHENLKNVNFQNLLKAVSSKELTSLLDQAKLFVSANWTMLPMMNLLWKYLVEEVIPQLSVRPTENPRYLFVDIADPAKRTDNDLLEALHLLGALGKGWHVNLGLNFAESCRVAKVLQLQAPSDTPQSLEDLAKQCCKKANLNTVVIHSTKFAVACTAEYTCCAQGPYTASPRFTTGAGDNFNAGFCNALLCGFPLEDCLLTGVATSGFYVREGKSPTMSELAKFIVGMK